MIKVDNIKVYNFENAFRGLRNPLNSWELSDSIWKDENDFIIGEKDLDLAHRMINGGTDESKFLRQIFISMDIEAPLYWWKEADTYKVATVANSCSTMHTIEKTPITLENYSFDPDGKKLTDLPLDDYIRCDQIIKHQLEDAEWLRKKYVETKDKTYWRLLIQILSNGWNQKRTYTFNYQTARAMYFGRNHHKVIEWRTFCEILQGLPYGKELISYKKENKIIDKELLKLIKQNIETSIGEKQNEN